MPSLPDAPLKVVQVACVEEGPSSNWLIERLWASQGVGLIGGAPKSCKTFLALEIAVAVASGRPCLGHIPVREPGPVLVFAAEDQPAQVRARIEGLARARGADFQRMPLLLILEEEIRLDRERDIERLEHALQEHRPRLLVLDPFVRMHRQNENSATDIAAILARLRALQRRFQLAILLVHHTRKGNGPVAGQALRGSSDLHAWGDSNLYLKKGQGAIRLAIEHRAAPAPEPLHLNLTGDPARLEMTAPEARRPEADIQQQILDALRRQTLNKIQLRAALQVRNQTLSEALQRLDTAGRITRQNGQWALVPHQGPRPQPDLFVTGRSVPTPP